MLIGFGLSFWPLNNLLELYHVTLTNDSLVKNQVKWNSLCLQLTYYEYSIYLSRSNLENNYSRIKSLFCLNWMIHYYKEFNNLRLPTQFNNDNGALYVSISSTALIASERYNYTLYAANARKLTWMFVPLTNYNALWWKCTVDIYILIPCIQGTLCKQGPSHNIDYCNVPNKNQVKFLIF